jgi:hypothetical protein
MAEITRKHTAVCTEDIAYLLAFKICLNNYKDNGINNVLNEHNVSDTSPNFPVQKTSTEARKFRPTNTKANLFAQVCCFHFSFFVTCSDLQNIFVRNFR